jgi:hypothetical protein
MCSAMSAASSGRNYGHRPNSPLLEAENRVAIPVHHAAGPVPVFSYVAVGFAHFRDPDVTLSGRKLALRISRAACRELFHGVDQPGDVIGSGVKHFRRSRYAVHTHICAFLLPKKSLEIASR